MSRRLIMRIAIVLAGLVLLPLVFIGLNGGTSACQDHLIVVQPVPFEFDADAIAAVRIDGQPMDDGQIAIAKIAIGVGYGRAELDFDPVRDVDQDNEMAVAMGLTESRLHNIPYGEGDMDSQNWTQARSSQGWGTRKQLEDPVYVANAFFGGVPENGKKGLEAFDNRYEIEPWQAIAQVQRPKKEYEIRYSWWADEAAAIVAAVDRATIGTVPDPPDINLDCAISFPAVNSGSADGPATELAALGYQNGRLPAEILQFVSVSCRITSIDGAAEAWNTMAAAAAEDGVFLGGGDCYRTYEAQAQAYRERGCPCNWDPFPPTAPPGSSNHGWGYAVDIIGARGSILTCSSPEFAWLNQNAARFGWVHPGWAHCNKSTREPWHWEWGGLLTPTTTGREVQ